MNQPIQDAIKKRRSIREYTSEPVPTELLRQIVSAGIWAPSGLNNQPWRFVLVQDEKVRKLLAQQTTYSHIILAAHSLIVVLVDRSSMYDEVKDHQSAGACIQNMLLAAEELGLGAVWLGQILKNKKQVNAILNLDDNFDLMAVLAVGYPLHKKQKSRRKPIAEFILQEIGGDLE